MPHKTKIGALSSTPTVSNSPTPTSFIFRFLCRSLSTHLDPSFGFDALPRVLTWFLLHKLCSFKLKVEGEFLKRKCDW